jgi:hypothetical protein
LHRILAEETFSRGWNRYQTFVDNFREIDDQTVANLDDETLLLGSRFPAVTIVALAIAAPSGAVRSFRQYQFLYP